MKKLLFLTLGFFLLAGCGPAAQLVTVDAVTNPELSSPGNSYTIVPLAEEVAGRDLHFIAFSEQVQKVLSASGLNYSADPDKARLTVFLGYGVSEPQPKLVQRTEPVYGAIPVYGTYRVYDSASDSFYAVPYYSSRFGIVGNQRVTYTSAQYLHSLFLIGCTVEKGRGENAQDKVERLWQVLAVSADDKGDLREIFPALLDAAKNYIGKNPGKTISVEVRPDGTTQVKK